MSFTKSEQARIKHFLSYPDWQSLTNGINLGVPAGNEALFLLEQTFKRLSPEAEDSVRRDLCECESIECQLSEARKRFKTAKVGEVVMNKEEVAMLKDELHYWGVRLADDLGVVRDPYSQADHIGLSGGGINGTWSS